MTGYNYQYGMSNRALDAYENGIKPLSRITCQDLKFAGWKGTKKEALAIAKAGRWLPAEWHHSGGTWYNKVDFYDPHDLVEYWQSLSPSEQIEVRLNALRESQRGKEEKKVRGSYTVWGGTHRRPRRLYDEVFTGTLIGEWIHLDGGGRKKATGNHITWEII